MDMDTFMTNETRNYFDDDSFSATSMFNKTRGILNDVTMQNKTMLLSNTMIGMYLSFDLNSVFIFFTLNRKAKWYLS